MRVAIYARTAQQDSEYIKKQVKKCEVLAKRKAINVQGIYIDDGFSSVGEKPQLNKLMSKLYKYDCVIVQDIARLTRNMNEYIELEKQFKKSNIELYFANKN